MIEMFDHQYYLQMYRELQSIAPELEVQEAKERAEAVVRSNEKEQKRLERIHQQYDVAIRKKIAEQTNKRLDTDERREQLCKAQKAFRERNQTQI